MPGGVGGVAPRGVPLSRSMVESECDAGGFRSTLSVAAPFVWRCLTRLPVAPVSTPTGSPETVARPRFPQNVACGFPAPTLFGSCFTALQAPAAPGSPVGEAQFRCQQRCPFFDLVEGVPGEATAGPAAAAQHPAPVTLHDPIYFDETPKISGDAVISIVAA